jgi:hypothetical protein
VPVADVEVEDASARVQQVLDLLAEMREIRRVQRRLDLDCPHPVAPSHTPILGPTEDGRCCFTTAVRRFLRKFSFVPVLVILGGFVAFSLWVADPLKEAERESLVTGSLHPADPLRPDGPFIPYVALHKGELQEPESVPEFPLDDAQPEGDGKFELSADELDGQQFYLLARFETAKSERYCKTVPLPRMRRNEDGVWLEAATGKQLQPLRIAIDKSLRCD